MGRTIRAQPVRRRRQDRGHCLRAYYPEAFVRRAVRAVLEEPKMVEMCNFARWFELAKEETDFAYARATSEKALEPEELRRVEMLLDVFTRRAVTARSPR